MSHHRNSPTTIQVAGCPVAPYIPETWYLVTGLAQGNLGNYSVLTWALDSNSLAENVTIFPANEVTGQGWEAHINWDGCQLDYVHDTYDNEIYGPAMVSDFRWHEAEFTKNVIKDISLLNISSAAITQFHGNTIEGDTTELHLIGASSIIFNNNTIKESVTIDIGNIAASTGINLTFRDNVLSGDSIINFYFNTVPQNIVRFIGNNVHNGSIISSAGPNTRIENTNISEYASIDLDNSNVPITIDSCFLSGGGKVESDPNITNVAGSISVVNTACFSNGRVYFPPANITELVQVSSCFMINNGHLVMQLGTGSATNAVIETGTLNSAGFTLTDVRLMDDNSTLVANVTDAKKDGYVNALP